jgi:hypothetical protein
MYRRSLPGNVVIDHPTFEDLKIWKFENFKLPQKQRLRNRRNDMKIYKVFYSKYINFTLQFISRT